MAPVPTHAEEKPELYQAHFKIARRRTCLILLDVLLLDLLTGVAAEHILRLSTIAAPTLL
jgi:hypothetical protein